jgi:hypothetical protein
MRHLLGFSFGPTRGAAGVALIHLAAGLIFLTQGILKYIFLIVEGGGA